MVFDIRISCWWGLGCLEVSTRGTVSHQTGCLDLPMELVPYVFYWTLVVEIHVFRWCPWLRHPIDSWSLIVNRYIYIDIVYYTYYTYDMYIYIYVYIYMIHMICIYIYITHPFFRHWSARTPFHPRSRSQVGRLIPPGLFIQRCWQLSWVYAAVSSSLVTTGHQVKSAKISLVNI